jgi:hypothetical protein
MWNLKAVDILKHFHSSPGHTALYGLITAKASENVISREADKIK